MVQTLNTFNVFEQLWCMTCIGVLNKLYIFNLGHIYSSVEHIRHFSTLSTGMEGN